MKSIYFSTTRDYIFDSKEKKDTLYLKNWRPVILLNVDYKIATKTIALRIEKMLPHLINRTQTGYVRGRFIGEGIRLILDIMEYTYT